MEEYDTLHGIRGEIIYQENRQNKNNSYNKNRTDDRSAYFNETYDRMSDEKKRILAMKKIHTEAKKHAKHKDMGMGEKRTNNDTIY